MNKKTPNQPPSKSVDRNLAGTIHERWPTIAITAILIITAGCYWGSLKNNFTSFDDIDYILSNPNIQQLSAKSVVAFFTTFSLSNYHPLTTSLWAVCFKYFAAQPFAYHLAGLIFHLLNILLVFTLFRKLSNSIYIPVFVAALFALHPLNVESVAWISELKNVLYAFFFLLSAIYYLNYLSHEKRSRFYIFSLLFFLASLLSKSAAVTLPLTLLVIDLYKERRDFKAMLIEKLPFLGLSIIFGIIAIISQHEGMIPGYTPHASLLSRILYAAYGLGYYIRMIFVPVQLSAIHFIPEGVPPLGFYLTSLLVPAWIVALVTFKKYRKELIFGSLFYFVNLLMVLQLIPFGKAVVAERYAYLPMLGIFFIVAFLFDKICAGFFKKKSVYGLMIWMLPLAAGIIFTSISYNRTRVWKDSQTLFADVVKKYPDQAFAHFALGNAKKAAGDNQGSLQCYNKSISIKPDAETFNNRGWLHFSFRNSSAALSDFESAIKLDSTNSQVYFGHGLTLIAIDEYRSAIPDLDRAISLKPGFIDAITTKAYCYFKMGKMKDALANYSLAYYYAPQSTVIPFNIATIYQKWNDRESACNYFKISSGRGYVPSMDSVRAYCEK